MCFSLENRQIKTSNIIIRFQYLLQQYLININIHLCQFQIWIDLLFFHYVAFFLSFYIRICACFSSDDVFVWVRINECVYRLMARKKLNVVNFHCQSITCFFLYTIIFSSNLRVVISYNSWYVFSNWTFDCSTTEKF